jgi:cytoskeletal protein RodZ
MAARVHLTASSLKFGIMVLRAEDQKKMRLSLAVAVVLVGISVSGWAQQNNHFKVRVTHEKPAKQSASLTKQSTGNTAASADAKALQNVERQSAKGSGHSAATKKAPALKPVKDKPNPPVNFNGTGGGGVKGGGRASTGSNPYKGRLKQKGGGSGHQ